MTTISQALKLGINAQKSGDFQLAELYYVLVLDNDPNNALANHNLGVLFADQKLFDKALKFFHAAALNGGKKQEFWTSYIKTLVLLERHDEARYVLDQASSLSIDSSALKQIEKVIFSQSTALEKRASMETNFENMKSSHSASEISTIENARRNISAGSLSQWTKTLQDFFESKKYDEIIELEERLAKLFPHSVELRNIIGLTFQAVGDYNSAIKNFESALTINSNIPEVLNNLGTALHDAGRYDEAVIKFKKALKIDQNFANAYFNLGSTENKRRNFKAAIYYYKLAISSEPKNALFHFNLGNTYANISGFDEAIDYYKKSIEYKNDFPAALNNLGQVLVRRGDLNDAMHYFEQAITSRGDYGLAYVNIIELLEKVNQLQKMKEFISQAKNKLVSLPIEIQLSEALLFFRAKNYEQALEILTTLDVSKISKSRRPNYMNLLGNVYDCLKNFSNAFDCYSKMNHLVANSTEFNNSAYESYFQNVVNRSNELRTLTNQKSLVAAKSYSDTSSIHFLVGFPRSGTTLLDTMLRAHSKIQVIEEGPMLQNVLQSFKKELDVASIEELSEAETAIAKEIYIQALTNYQSKHDEFLCIDKMPLHINEVPLIHRLFPNAKFILALRHPLDCILSCWMQKFPLNEAMGNMVDLDRICDLYCASMEIFDLSANRYKLKTYKIRYEDTVSDTENEMRNLLSFLDTEWEDKVTDNRSSADRRAFINTPSYWQVVQPIYQTSKYRWSNYESEIKTAIPKLDFWVKKFGYDYGKNYVRGPKLN